MLNIIRDYWGDKLVKLSTQIVNKLQLPKPTIDFLIEVGLPDDEAISEISLLAIKFNLLELNEKFFNQQRYIIFGNIHGGLEVAFMENTSEIFVLAPSHFPYLCYFMNTSVVHLLMFIKTLLVVLPTLDTQTVEIDKYFFNQKNLTSEERQKWAELQQQQNDLYRSTIDILRNVDTKAFENNINYWPSVLRQ